MAFYTPSWLRKVIKEDAKYIVDYVSKDSTKDFRSYVDARLPFVLWLELGEIKEKVLKPNISLLDKTIELAFPSHQRKWAKETLESALLNAYKTVINKYIDNPRYKEVSYDELDKILQPLSTLQVGQIRSYLSTAFKSTLRVGGSLSRKNKSVMLIAPNFNAIKFGKDFRDAIDLSVFGSTNELEEDPKTGEYVQTAYSRIRDILNDTTGKITGKRQDFYTQLQNVGHIEVDVVSEADRKVKRGQVSPRFLQALVSVPNQPGVISKLQSDFSKQTLQSQTRVLVRKKFSRSKLVFEMLIEYGIPVGIPESQVTNLQKAAREAAFGPGSGLTAQIRKNPNILYELETSRSAKKYLENNLRSLLATGKQLPQYTSIFRASQSNSKTINTVRVKKFNKTVSSLNIKNPGLPPRILEKPASISAINLQELINNRLQEQIKANMGDGSRRDILNYRTGRFANSVKVERVSESRQGMITAFYSYMKYPYASFSRGGRQELPRSRDPKTLISKSIREIAASLVGNRMRAVSL